MPHKKRKVGKKAKLLKRVSRLARTAAVLRLRGNIQRANEYERTLDRVMDEAERIGVGDRAMDREMHGRQRGDRLYHKVVKRRLGK